MVSEQVSDAICKHYNFHADFKNLISFGLFLWEMRKPVRYFGVNKNNFKGKW